MTKNPVIEGLKEVGRWVLLFVASWIITETLSQVVVIPETWDIHVWQLVYPIPLRLLVKSGLTLLGRFVDKFLYERGKLIKRDGWLGIKGLVGF